MSSAGRLAFKSREEYKKAKELEEARKAGTAAPEVDEDGNDINPHIPQYIAQVPWYVPSEGPSLKHQRNLKAAERQFDKLGAWYARGEQAGPAATKYRKGACENCGSMTHKRKDCLERPRAKGAKWTGRDIAADDVVREVNLDWEGKRDRWNGYRASSYKKVQERYAKLEAERRRLRAEKLDIAMREGKGNGDGRDNSSDSEGDDAGADDEDKAGFRPSDVGNVVIQQKDRATPATVRNLRIREDTAKYLRNLDVNSAYYDPKTRSMRADPNPEINPEDKDFAGDNFVRLSGDVKNLARMELHALKANEEGRELPHLLADPTTAEEVFKDFASRKKSIEERRQTSVLERYGGEEYLVNEKDPDAPFQSEAYVEYDREGHVVEGKEEKRPVSKYPEDVLLRNHSAIWGSFYIDRKWGYACCHETTRNAYCTGESGKRARIEVEKEMKEKTVEAFKRRMEIAERQEEARKKRGESITALDSREAKRKRKAGNDGDSPDAKRVHHSLASGIDGLDEKEVEQYRLEKDREEDPMANYVDEKEQQC